MMQVFAALLCLVVLTWSCGSKEEATADKPVEKIRDAVKDAVTQDFKILESAKDTLKQSEEKTKAALEALEREAK